jgi:hypothetical protein
MTWILGLGLGLVPPLRRIVTIGSTHLLRQLDVQALALDYSKLFRDSELSFKHLIKKVIKAAKKKKKLFLCVSTNYNLRLYA